MSALLHHHAHTEEQRQAAARLLEEAMPLTPEDYERVIGPHYHTRGQRWAGEELREKVKEPPRLDLDDWRAPLVYHELLNRTDRLLRAADRVLWAAAGAGGLWAAQLVWGWL
jgi:hypothetical protein